MHPSKPTENTRPLDTQPPSLDSFYDNHVAPLARSNPPDHHDSHHVNFSERVGARESVVDNMLLSLDQFSTGHIFGNVSSTYTSFSDDNSFLRDNSYRPPGGRHRGHTCTSSRSSDYDARPDETCSAVAQHPRRRRTNSIANIGTPSSSHGSFANLYAGHTSSPCGQHYPRGQSRGGALNDTNGSGSPSKDSAQGGLLAGQRFGFGKRAVSFDQSNNERSRMALANPVLDRGRAAYQNFLEDDFDAAPEPNVPTSPRRFQDTPPQSPVAYTPPPSYAPPLIPGTHRRSSVRSSTSYNPLRKKITLPEATMRSQAQDFINASALRDVPIIPLSQDSSAPSPTVGARMSGLQQTDSSPAPKEKTGFFRRVFGGGASRAQIPPSITVHNPNLGSSPAPSATQLTESDSIYPQAAPCTTLNNSNIQSKSLSKGSLHSSPSQRDLQQASPPTVTKKPSSFFRRRKKSMSENTKPPIMAVDLTPPNRPVFHPQPNPDLDPRRDKSPHVNEPRVAADRFYDSRELQATKDESSEETSRSFSPGYKPHKDATVRTVKPNFPGADESDPSSRDVQSRASVNNCKLKLKVGNRQRDTLAVGYTDYDDGRLSPSSSLDKRNGVSAPPTSPAHGGYNVVDRSNSEVRAELLLRNSDLTTQDTEVHNYDRHTAPYQKNDQLLTGPDIAKAERADDPKLGIEVDLASQSPDNLSQATQIASSPTSPQHDVFYSATSLPIVQVDKRESLINSQPLPLLRPETAEVNGAPAVPELAEGEPTDDDRERAQQIYSGDETCLLKSQAAATLGDVTSTATRMRKAFFDLFDFTNVNILAAMRDMCSKLVLKAETQQVDRILMSLAERWSECNANHGFKAVDVVHTICYSILLLNTDLHLADIESRMTRSQFVRNTLPTVLRVCQDAVKTTGGGTLRPQSTHFRRPSLPWNDRSEPTPPSPDTTSFTTETSEEPQQDRRTRSRLSIRPSGRTGGSDGLFSVDTNASESNILVNHPYNGPMRGWEIQIEVVLKDTYDSIRKQRLPLHGSSEPCTLPPPSSNSLSVSGMLRRTPSVLSKTPSENMSYRGRSQPEYRSAGPRWTAKNRSRQKLYPSSTVASSRTSLDDGSVWSPTGSSSWSRFSHGKTGTSMSVNSLGSHLTGDFQQAIGFANALSQAIIREEGVTVSNDEEFTRVAPLLEDETLELVGAPWAKEGILKHKRHLEAVHKKAKDRAWTECFAVVEKGYMRLFSFNMNSKSMRNKNKMKSSAGGVVGGGNWMDNAEALDCFPLRQTIVSALPPPGYSKSRPHVFALSLPNGAVHLFQVGTPDIVREFVCTANYWSARLSKEPLTGGVSSMEYGWGENVINTALIRRNSNGKASVKGHVPRPSMTSSLRSSMDHATGAPKARLPGDKANLFEWTPPSASMMASNLMEVDQLRALTDYVKNIEGELSHHNELRAPLLIAFSPRHPNAQKAMANWERKSQYLLREIVKFRTYIDCLTTAQVQKQKIYAERAARAAKDVEAADATAEASKNMEEDGVNEGL